MRLRLLSLLCLALAAGRLSAAEMPQAVPVDGPRFAAALAGADADWRLTLRGGDKPTVLPAADVLIWGRFAEPSRGPLVLLADGSLVVADVFRIDKDHVTLDSDLFAAVKLPLDGLVGVVFQPPAAGPERDRLFDRLRAATGDADQIVLDNGDQIGGMLQSLADDTLVFRAEIGELKLPVRRVKSLVLNPSLRRSAKLDGLRAWTGFSDGSRLLATRLMVDDQSVAVTAVGQTWKTTPRRLVALQPLGGKVVYLSDLKPAGYRHVPYLDLAWPYQLDRNCAGGMLHCGGRLYLKGLGVHSAARLSYVLDRPYRRFDAELGIDDSTHGAGSVRFRVLVDGRERLTSEIIRGGAPPVPVSVELAGAKRLDLLVDFADRADVLDHADWLDARLVPATPGLTNP